jgi:hypothetical protein
MRMNSQTMEELTHLAHEEGMSPSALARHLVVQGIRRRKDNNVEATRLLQAIEDDPVLLTRLRRMTLFGQGR